MKILGILLGVATIFIMGGAFLLLLEKEDANALAAIMCLIPVASGIVLIVNSSKLQKNRLRNRADADEALSRLQERVAASGVDVERWAQEIERERQKSSKRRAEDKLIE